MAGRAPYIRTSWMALAVRQPRTMTASSHAAMVPMNGWFGHTLSATELIGTAQTRTHATVRHGTNQRASGLACAASATATGNSRRV